MSLNTRGRNVTWSIITDTLGRRSQVTEPSTRSAAVRGSRRIMIEHGVAVRGG